MRFQKEIWLNTAWDKSRVGEMLWNADVRDLHYQFELNTSTLIGRTLTLHISPQESCSSSCLGCWLHWPPAILYYTHTHTHTEKQGNRSQIEKYRSPSFKGKVQHQWQILFLWCAKRINLNQTSWVKGHFLIISLSYYSKSATTHLLMTNGDVVRLLNAP